MASILRKGKNWYISYKREDGTWTQRSLRTTSGAKAKAILESYEVVEAEQVLAGIIDVPEKEDPFPLEQVEWLTFENLNDAEKQAVRAAARQVRKEMDYDRENFIRSYNFPSDFEDNDAMRQSWTNLIQRVVKEVREGKTEGYDLAPALTWDGAWERFAASPRMQTVSERRAKELFGHFKHIRSYGEDRDIWIEGFDPRHVRDFQAHMLSTRSTETTRKVLGLGGRLFRACYPDRSNPFDSVERIDRNDVANKQPFTDVEEKAILEEATGDLYTVSLIMRATGMRFGDAVQLKWTAIDEDDGTIEVETSKSKRSVVLPLESTLREHLAGLTRMGERICAELAGFHHGTASKQYMAMLRNAGIETADEDGRVVKGAHSWRSLFATRMAAAGVPESDLRLLVGHSDARMTRRYVHATAKGYADAIETMNTDEEAD